MLSEAKSRKAGNRLIWVLIACLPLGMVWLACLPIGMVGCGDAEEDPGILPPLTRAGLLDDFLDGELNKELVKELEEWKPDHENLVPFIKDILSPKVDIRGCWETPISLHGSRLTIQETKPNQYSIDFSTFGCMDNWTLKRAGTYSKGILRLNKPVQEYCPFTYDTLYAASVDGKEYLISQSEIRHILKHDSTDGVVDWSERIEISLFHRTSKAQLLLDRLNSWDMEELDAYERPDKYPNRVVSGETGGWVKAYKQELKKLDYEVKWDAEEKIYTIRVICKE